MSSNWPMVRLGDYVDSCLGKMLDKKKNKGTPRPYLGNSNVRWGAFDLANLAEMKFEESEHERYGLKAGDLIVCEGGEPGRCAVWQDEAPDMRIQKALHRIRPKRGLNNYYLYYWFMLSARTGGLEPYFTGTTIKHLTGKALNNLQLQLPPDEYQQAAVKVLRSLDDKIQINHQINQTLEQMAQSIFKSWFVDFEPVKTKIATLEAGGTEADALLAAMQVISGKDADQLNQMRAEQPEQHAELRATAELFPSAMQDSELGEIPEGWACLALDTVAKYQNGLALQKFRPENDHEYLPVVKIAQLKKGYADGIEKASPNIKPDCIIDDGDVVFSWSGSLMVDTWCGGKAALNQHLFKVTSKSYPKWLYYYFTKHHLDEFQRIAAAKAVTMGHIKREHLKAALCAVPCKELIKVGTMVIGSLIDKQIEGRLESKNLAQLRDTLLPKLLSGELTLPDTEVDQAEPQDVANAAV